METIGNYIVPAIRIMVDFLLLGVIARCTYILYMAWQDGDIQKAFQSIWKRICKREFFLSNCAGR